MKADTQASQALVPHEECEVLNLIRDDHELIDRLNITPGEMEALSKCAMFGTMTCKQHMLAILRQIREAGGPAEGGSAFDQTPLYPEPAIPEEEEGTALPDCRKMLIRLNDAGTHEEPGSLAGVPRQGAPQRLAILAWTTLAVAGLGWSLLILMFRWRHNVMTGVGMPAGQAGPSTASTAWYSGLDRSNTLLWGEVLFVVGMVIVMFLKSHRGSRRFKIKPRQSWR
ncbi:hypothetical protein [Candidatus Binatus sp.]|jgi:hypothetical protein|uniref:hypothetical protein n=1 Tax=Candidatus Binatus sp. TaxID=2811406 RepID=UPI003F9874EE